jgi:flagellar assembly factor FliW
MFFANPPAYTALLCGSLAGLGTSGVTRFWRGKVRFYCAFADSMEEVGLELYDFEAILTVACRLLIQNGPFETNGMNILELAELEQPRAQGNDVVLLPYGLLGFERVKNFSLVSNADEEPFQWLKFLDNARHGFLVLPPTAIVPDYNPQLEDEDANFLDLDESAEILTLGIVTVRESGPTTVNLKGPIVINRATWVGKQVIPKNAARYSARHPLKVA